MKSLQPSSKNLERPVHRNPRTCRSQRLALYRAPAKGTLPACHTVNMSIAELPFGWYVLECWTLLAMLARHEKAAYTLMSPPIRGRSSARLYTP